MKNKAKLIPIAISISLALILVVVGIALAATLPLDTFDGTTPDLTVTVASVGSPVFANGFGPGGLGGQRDVIITATGSIVNQSLNVRPDQGLLSFTQGNGVAGKAEIQYDSPSDNGSPVLDPTGLGGMNISSGGGDGFHIEIKFDDLPMTITIKVYSNATDWSYDSVRTPGGIRTIDHVDLFLPFNQFKDGGGAGADFTSVGAIVLELDGTLNPGADLALDLIDIDNFRDFGDLPNGFGHAITTTEHIPNGVRLGTNVDIEADSHPSAGANGDDLDQFPPDDEDGIATIPGISWTPGLPGEGAGGRLQVTINGCPSTCWLDGWIDWGHNNNFSDNGDKIYKNIAVTNGTVVRPFIIPAGTVIPDQSFYGRFRICQTSTECQFPNGSANSGEVEDHLFTFKPTAITLSSLSAVSRPSNTVTILLVATGLLAAFLMGGFALLRRRKA